MYKFWISKAPKIQKITHCLLLIKFLTKNFLQKIFILSQKIAEKEKSKMKEKKLVTTEILELNTAIKRKNFLLCFFKIKKKFFLRFFSSFFKSCLLSCPPKTCLWYIMVTNFIILNRTLNERTRTHQINDLIHIFVQSIFFRFELKFSVPFEVLQQPRDFFFF